MDARLPEDVGRLRCTFKRHCPIDFVRRREYRRLFSVQVHAGRHVGRYQERNALPTRTTEQLHEAVSVPLKLEDDESLRQTEIRAINISGNQCFYVGEIEIYGLLHGQS